MANPTETKFGDPATRIAQTDHWTVLLRPKQVTLGALVLVCREPVKAFADVSPEAYADLRGVVRQVERVLKELVAFERINYLMLMMVDPDVHFHVFPRYPSPRAFGGTEHADAGWPGPPVLDSGFSPDAATRDALVARLKDAWDRAGG
ncbi:MAG TPA: HIT family protein [Nevskiaceae bacterium]|nr:HIT family protein [Nevskiaceae bacterium]